MLYKAVVFLAFFIVYSFPIVKGSSTNSQSAPLLSPPLLSQRKEKKNVMNGNEYKSSHSTLTTPMSDQAISKQAVDCSTLDCYECALYSHCDWCTTPVCACEQSKSNSIKTKWYDKVDNCSATLSLCPFSEYIIDHDFERTIHFNGQLGKNAFCKWEVHNSNNYEVNVEITKYVKSLINIIDNG